MSPPSQAALEAIELEIGPIPRMALLERAAEVPEVPKGPTVLVIEIKLPEIPGQKVAAHFRTAERLLEAVNILIRHEHAHWLIEVHEPQEFAAAYRKLLYHAKPNEASPALVYVPFHDTRERRSLLDESLSRARSMLKMFYREHSEATHAETDSSDTKPLEAARARRVQLLKEVEWLNAGEVHEQQTGGDPNASGANNTASRLRRRGELLGAWDGREYLHPVFQFDRRTGQLMPEMKDLIELLPKDRGGWRQTFWLFQPHALLDGKRPADVFPTDPHAVIEAARTTFVPGNTNW
jgi:hypothetical protein